MQMTDCLSEQLTNRRQPGKKSLIHLISVQKAHKKGAAGPFSAVEGRSIENALF